MVSWEDFAILVQERFAFLCDDYGFSVVSCESPFCTYQRGEITISLHYKTSGSGELDLLIRQKPVELGKWTPAKRLSNFRSHGEILTTDRPEDEFCRTIVHVGLKLDRMARLLMELCASGELFRKLEMK